MKKNDILALGLITLICLFLCWPFFHTGFFNIHDNQSVGRLYELHQALMAGQFPVRWVRDLGFGFGYPLFNFYPPLSYYFGEIWHLVGFSFLDSTKIVYGLSLFLSAVAMYAWARNKYSVIASFIGSLLYILATYRAVDVYVRGALAEAFAFVWLPLILLFLEKYLNDKKTKDILLAGLFYGALMLTHNLIVMPFSLLIVLYFGLAVLLKTKNKIGIKGRFLRFLPCFLKMAFWGLGLSAFFWLPALILKNKTIVGDILLNNLYSYKLHFVELSQLWNSPWGYGGSVAGPADGVSFEVGKIQLIGALAAILSLFFKKNRRVILYFFLFVFSLFMTTKYSSFLWQVFSPIQFMQFPWRWLTFVLLFSGILTALFLNFLENKSKFLFIGFCIFMIVFLIKSNFKLFKPQAYTAVSDSDFASSYALSWENSASSFEFSPKGVKLVADERFAKTNKIDIAKGNYATNRVSKEDEDRLGVYDISDKPQVLSFKNKNNGKIVLNMFSFPGWTLFINGKKTPYNIYGDYKLISFDLPPQSEVVLKYKQSGLIAFANAVSLFSLLLLVYKLARPNE